MNNCADVQSVAHKQLYTGWGNLICRSFKAIVLKDGLNSYRDFGWGISYTKGHSALETSEAVKFFCTEVL